MNDKFLTLEKEKQDRMINACLKVFAINGYRKASTDDIVKEAGISKGLLFHYFDSKAGAYKFVYEYSARYYSMELTHAVSLREHDLFTLMSQIEDARYVMLTHYPYLLRFLLTYDLLEDEEMKEGLKEFEILVPGAMKEIYDRVDFTRLKSEVDPDMLIRNIEYMTRGLMESAIDKGLGADHVKKEAKACLSMLRQAFTKEDFL